MSRVKRLLGLFLIAGAWVYAAGIAAWFALHTGFGDSFWWLALVNSFAVELFIPVPFILLIGLWRQRPSVIASVLVPFAIFVALFHEQLTPKLNQTVPPGASGLRVMTYNVDSGTQDSEPIVERIQAEDPDVVFLEEVNRSHVSGLNRLKPDYPYQIVQPMVNSSGLAILSRYPLGSSKFLTLGGNPRAGLYAEIMWDGQAVGLAAVHLIPTYPALSLRSLPEQTEMTFRVREQQATDLVALARTSRLPLIIGGDFNMAETHRAYSIVREELIDSQRESGWGFDLTFPAEAGNLHRLIATGLTWFTHDTATRLSGSRVVRLIPPLPLVRLDYIFHSTNLTSTQAHVSAWDGQSPHLAFVATLHWR